MADYSGAYESFEPAKTVHGAYQRIDELEKRLEKMENQTADGPRPPRAGKGSGEAYGEYADPRYFDESESLRAKISKLEIENASLRDKLAIAKELFS
jgi:BMFP domain-containing protein YqiC